MVTSLFLFACCTCLLVADVQCGVWSRERRSDDPPALQTVVSDLSQQLTQTRAQLTALQNTVEQQQQQHDQLQAKFDSAQKMVAFTARHGSSDARFNVASQGTVINNVAEVNLGGGYDTVTGVFTCPTAGLYLFFTNCDTSSSVDLNTGIVVDGTRVAGCYAHASWDQGAGVAAVRLRAGQKVWVKMYRDSRDVEGGLWNSFSGFLIRSED